MTNYPEMGKTKDTFNQQEKRQIYLKNSAEIRVVCKLAKKPNLKTTENIDTMEKVDTMENIDTMEKHRYDGEH